VTYFREPIPEAEQSDQKRQEERDRARLAIEIFVLAVLIIGTKFAWDNIQLLNHNLREATRSANAAVDAANIARDSLVTENRPWIYFERRPLTRLLENSDITTTMAIQSRGATPALNVRGCFAIEVVTTSTPTWGLRPCYAVEINTLRPGSDQAALVQAFMPNSKPPAKLIPDHQLALNVAGGRSYVMVHGRFEYEDVFGVSHWVELCENLFPQFMAQAVGSPHPAIAACAKYNRMDANTRTENQRAERQPQ
jgi:hypothetical protein